MGHLLYTLIGFIYLWIRYRNREKVKEAKREKYEDQYSVAGAVLILSVLGVFLFALLSVFLLVVIYAIFTKPPSRPY